MRVSPMLPESQATWIGVAFGVLTLGGAVVTGLFAWLNSKVNRERERDKLEYDARWLSLTQKQKDCEEKHEQCEEQNAAVLKKLEACEEKHESTDARISALEHRHPSPQSGKFKKPPSKE